MTSIPLKEGENHNKKHLKGKRNDKTHGETIKNTNRDIAGITVNLCFDSVLLEYEHHEGRVGNWLCLLLSPAMNIGKNEWIDVLGFAFPTILIKKNRSKSNEQPTCAIMVHLETKGWRNTF